MKKEITLITTWDNEVIELNASFDEWIKSKNWAKAKWEDWFKPKWVDRYIKFANIKDERWKTQYLALEAPKKEFKLFTPEERKNFNKAKEIILEKTKEWRMKKFIAKRENILKQLARDEERFWLETTISKLEEYKILKNKDLILNNKICEK